MKTMVALVCFMTLAACGKTQNRSMSRVADARVGDPAVSCSDPQYKMLTEEARDYLLSTYRNLIPSAGLTESDNAYWVTDLLGVANGMAFHFSECSVELLFYSPAQELAFAQAYAAEHPQSPNNVVLPSPDGRTAYIRIVGQLTTPATPY